MPLSERERKAVFFFTLHDRETGIPIYLVGYLWCYSCRDGRPIEGLTGTRKTTAIMRSLETCASNLYACTIVGLRVQIYVVEYISLLVVQALGNPLNMFSQFRKGLQKCRLGASLPGVLAAHSEGVTSHSHTKTSLQKCPRERYNPTFQGSGVQI